MTERQMTRVFLSHKNTRLIESGGAQDDGALDD